MLGPFWAPASTRPARKSASLVARQGLGGTQTGLPSSFGPPPTALRRANPDHRDSVQGSLPCASCQRLEPRLGRDCAAAYVHPKSVVAAFPLTLRRTHRV